LIFGQQLEAIIQCMCHTCKFCDVVMLIAGVEHTLHHFLDTARRTEAFFLSQRLRLSVQKPEQMLKEVAVELILCQVDLLLKAAFNIALLTC